MKTYTRDKIDQIAATLDCRVVGLRQTRTGQTVTVQRWVTSSPVRRFVHAGAGVFSGLPSPLMATRYHSLVVDRDTLPDCLEVTSWLDDGLIMGLRHRSLPIEGVQFHPESIRSEHGHAMLRNFLDMAKAPA
jgi:anthranilate synthase component 2